MEEQKNRDVSKKQKQGIIGIYLCVYVYLYMCHTTHIHMLFHNNSSRNKNNKNIESKTTTVRVRTKRKKEKLSQHKISWSDEKEDRINEILCVCVLLDLCLDVCQSSSRSVTQTHTRTSSVANMRKNCKKASPRYTVYAVRIVDPLEITISSNYSFTKVCTLSTNSSTATHANCMVRLGISFPLQLPVTSL